MSTTAVRGWTKAHPLIATVVLAVIGYATVIGTFIGFVPANVFPELTLAAVNRLADAIAIINAINVFVIAYGWRAIRRGEVKKHATAMMSSFALIIIFLGLYLTKIGGGGTKEFVGPSVVYYPYLAMLAVHIILSIISVPVVLYALILGATHTPEELRMQTPHRRVGRIAASTWILSLSLGVIAYLLLNHAYGWEYIESTGAVVVGIILR
ncbi:MAG: putative membrane protein [Haloquadratum sp. J07HQX50]|nr:MAG: putative membrane protein [Haloquadratum sp. J07HQX50]